MYNILCRTLSSTKPLHIGSNKIDRLVRVYDGNRCLVLFGPKKYTIYKRTRYLISQKSHITYVFSHNYAIKVNLYDSLPLENTLTLHNVIILIKSVFDKYQNNHHWNIFLEKCSYLLVKK